MKKICLISLLAPIAIFCSLSVFAREIDSSLSASKIEYNSIQECAIFLPKGHRFKLEIIGTIDTNNPNNMFSGTFGLTDEDSDIITHDVDRFVGCVKNLLKSGID